MKWKCPKCGREFSRQSQDHYCIKPQSVDEYIAAQDETIQPKLNEIRTVLRSALPDAEERISWSMPTYRKDHNIIHFAAQKKHIGLYPGPEAVAYFPEGWIRPVFYTARDRFRSHIPMIFRWS
jgi:uncharacterized protein YdhG (YjbR/CyaY superfamily)